MVDWTNSAGAAFWHDTLRQPLGDIGIIGHWTDLGEPEMVAPNSWYAGLPGLGLHDQLANHKHLQPALGRQHRRRLHTK